MPVKESILHKLENLSERYAEIAALLGEADVINDQAQFRKLSIEYSQLEDVAHGFRDYQRTANDIAAAKKC